MRPMLCGSMDLRDIDRYLIDDEWYAQQKLDGDRLLIHVSEGRVVALNRDGRPRSNPVPAAVLRQFAPFAATAHEWMFDGELLTSGEFWLFDLPVAGGSVSPDNPFTFRYEVLERIFSGGAWQPDPCVRLLPLARTEKAKRALLGQLHERGAEGLVFRHTDSRYRAGKRSDRVLKAKFVHTADVVVHLVRPDGRNNCTFRLFRDGVLEPAGSVSLDARPPVRPGDVIEVRYLYASDDSLLYQPVMVRVRTDKGPAECTVDQLHYTDRTVIPVTTYVRQRRRSRAVGVFVSVLDAHHPDSEFTDEGGRWVTVCDHDTAVNHLSLKAARANAPVPNEWCDDCRSLSTQKVAS